MLNLPLKSLFNCLIRTRFKKLRKSVSSGNLLALLTNIWLGLAICFFSTYLYAFDEICVKQNFHEKKEMKKNWNNSFFFTKFGFNWEDGSNEWMSE